VVLREGQAAGGEGLPLIYRIQPPDKPFLFHRSLAPVVFALGEMAVAVDWEPSQSSHFHTSGMASANFDRTAISRRQLVLEVGGT